MNNSKRMYLFRCDMVWCYILYIIICIYICTYRTEATEKYIRYIHRHRKILGLAQIIENLLLCSAFSNEMFHIGFGQMEDVPAVKSHLCPSQTHTHTHPHSHTLILTHYARTGLPVKGNQIQKGLSQLVLKADSTCVSRSPLDSLQYSRVQDSLNKKGPFLVFHRPAVHYNSKHVFALDKGANSVAQTLILPVDSSWPL